MQPQVSIVMPVYNNIHYIDMMLESVYNQIWDNIELILVNDGSADGTRERLDYWAAVLEKRGYAVVIIDQENRGIPTAVRNGLLKITGDYVCLNDCDDKLEPDYVSVMAGWLDEHPEDEWAACSFDWLIIESGLEKIRQPFPPGAKTIPCPPLMMEKYLSGWHSTEVWTYMVRSSYLKQCKVTDYFITDIRSTQEPGFLFPLIAGGGSLKVIDKPLYHYNHYQTRTSAHRSARRALEFQDNYLDMVIKTMDKLDAEEGLKEKWRVMARLAHKRFLIESLKKLDDGEEYLIKLASDAAELISTYFKPGPSISAEHILTNNFYELYPAVSDCMLGKQPGYTMPAGRVIGCGALGDRAKMRTAALIGTFLEPDILWDRSALPGDEVCGIPVSAPVYDALMPDDTVIIFPVIPAVCEQLRLESESRGIKNIYTDSDIKKIMPALKYPQFYSGCKFIFGGPLLMDVMHNI